MMLLLPWHARSVNARLQRLRVPVLWRKRQGPRNSTGCLVPSSVSRIEARKRQVYVHERGIAAESLLESAFRQVGSTLLEVLATEGLTQTGG